MVPKDLHWRARNCRTFISSRELARNAGLAFARNGRDAWERVEKVVVDRDRLEMLLSQHLDVPIRSSLNFFHFVRLGLGRRCK